MHQTLGVVLGTGGSGGRPKHQHFIIFFYFFHKKNLAPDDLTVPGYGEPAEVHHHLALLSVPQLDPAALVNIQLLNAELSL